MDRGGGGGLYRFGLFRSIQSTVSRLDKRTKLENPVVSETLDSNLGMFIPKLGLNIATADKFDKQHGIKINNNNGKTGINTHENITNKD